MTFYVVGMLLLGMSAGLCRYRPLLAGHVVVVGVTALITLGSLKLFVASLIIYSIGALFQYMLRTLWEHDPFFHS